MTTGGPRPWSANDPYWQSAQWQRATQHHQDIQSLRSGGTTDEARRRGYQQNFARMWGHNDLLSGLARATQDLKGMDFMKAALANAQELGLPTDDIEQYMAMHTKNYPAPGTPAAASLPPAGAGVPQLIAERRFSPGEKQAQRIEARAGAPRRR